MPAATTNIIEVIGRRAGGTLAAFACLALAGWAAIDLSAMVAEQRLATDLAQRRLAVARGERPLAVSRVAAPDGGSAKAHALSALLRTEDAQAAVTPVARARLADEALRHADEALRLRPRWGEGLAVRAFARAGSSGRCP